jgi:hypothetical protein
MVIIALYQPIKLGQKKLHLAPEPPLRGRKKGIQWRSTRVCTICCIYQNSSINKMYLGTGRNEKKFWIGQLQSKRLIHRKSALCWRPYRLHPVPHASCGQLQSKRLDTLVMCVLSVAVLACSLQKAIH